MVENSNDDLVDPKPFFVDYFVEIKPPKVEASVKVEALRVNSGVSNLRDNEVDTTHFFASFQTDHDYFKLQSGYVFCLNVSFVSWKSSKQEIVVDSTTEAEYIVASNAAKEVVWIKKFISDLGIVPSIVDPIELQCDNNGAITQAKEPRSHQRSKHILRRYHLI
jgi:hypothetical protein